VLVVEREEEARLITRVPLIVAFCSGVMGVVWAGNINHRLFGNNVSDVDIRAVRVTKRCLVVDVVGRKSRVHR
jgi:hypothetical protein